MLLCFEPYAGTLGRYDWPTMLSMIKDAGYDGIELPVDTRFFDFRSSDEKSQVFGRTSDLGLAVPSVCGMFPPEYQIGHPEHAQIAHDYVCELMDIAAEVGAKSAVVWPALPEGAYFEDCLETGLANLEKLLPRADSVGVDLAIEFEKGCMVDNYRDGLRLCEEMQRRVGARAAARCKLVADTYHVFNDRAHPQRLVEAAHSRIASVHASDSDRKCPGRGDFDHGLFYGTLKAVGWDGPVSVQYHVEEGAESIQEACEFLRPLL
jgi:sugar phosphate isomerase/epimerase